MGKRKKPSGAKLAEPKEGSAVGKSLAQWNHEVNRIVRCLNQVDSSVGRDNPMPRSSTKKFVLKAELYRTIKHLVLRGRAAHLEDALYYSIGKNKRITVDENPFYLGLLALKGDPRIDDGLLKDIDHCGKELLYAYRNRVPPELLNGFIAQVGGIRFIREKVKDPDAREPWYDKNLPWITWSE